MLLTQKNMQINNAHIFFKKKFKHSIKPLIFNYMYLRIN
jgi:hypothetical protein